MGFVFFLGFIFIIPILILGIKSIVMSIEVISSKGDTLEISKIQNISNIYIIQGILSLIGSIALIIFPFFIIIFGCGLATLIIGILIKNQIKNNGNDISVYGILSLIMITIEVLTPVIYFLI